MKEHNLPKARVSEGSRMTLPPSASEELPFTENDAPDATFPLHGSKSDAGSQPSSFPMLANPLGAITNMASAGDIHASITGKTGDLGLGKLQLSPLVGNQALLALAEDFLNDDSDAVPSALPQTPASSSAATPSTPTRGKRRASGAKPPSSADRPPHHSAPTDHKAVCWQTAFAELKAEHDKVTARLAEECDWRAEMEAALEDALKSARAAHEMQQVADRSRLAAVARLQELGEPLEGAPGGQSCVLKELHAQLDKAEAAAAAMASERDIVLERLRYSEMSEAAYAARIKDVEAERDAVRDHLRRMGAEMDDVADARAETAAVWEAKKGLERELAAAHLQLEGMRAELASYEAMVAELGDLKRAWGEGKVDAESVASPLVVLGGRGDSAASPVQELVARRAGSNASSDADANAPQEDGAVAEDGTMEGRSDQDGEGESGESDKETDSDSVATVAASVVLVTRLELLHPLLDTLLMAVGVVDCGLDDVVAKARVVVAEVMANLSDLRAVCEEKDAAVARLDEAVAEASAGELRLQEQVESLEGTIRVLEDSVDQLMRDRAEAVVEAEGARKAKVASEGQLASMGAALDAAFDRVQGLEERAKGLSKERDALTGQLATVTGQLAGERAARETGEREAAAKEKEASARLVELERRLAEAEAVAESAAERQRASRWEAEEATGAVVKLEARVAELTQQLQAAQAWAGELVAQLESARAAAGAVQAAAAEGVAFADPRADLSMAEKDVRKDLAHGAESGPVEERREGEEPRGGSPFRAMRGISPSGSLAYSSSEEGSHASRSDEGSCDQGGLSEDLDASRVSSSLESQEQLAELEAEVVLAERRTRELKEKLAMLAEERDGAVLRAAEAQGRMRELETERDAAARMCQQVADERDCAVELGREFVVEKDREVRRLRALEQEHARALVQLAQVEKERDAATAGLKAALADRERAALSAREFAEQQQLQAMLWSGDGARSLEGARGELERAWARAREAEMARDKGIQQSRELRAERDVALRDAVHAAAGRDAAVMELERAREERDEAVLELGHAREERDAALARVRRADEGLVLARDALAQAEAAAEAAAVTAAGMVRERDEAVMELGQLRAVASVPAESQTVEDLGVLEDEVAAMRARVGELEARRVELEAALASANDSLERVQGEMEQAQKERDEAHQERDQVERKKEQVDRERDQAQRERDCLQKERDGLQKEKVDVLARLADVEEEKEIALERACLGEETRARAAARVAELRKEVEALTEQVRSVTEAKEGVEAELRAAQASAAEATDRLGQERDGALCQVARLEAELAKVAGTLARVEGERDEAGARVKQAEEAAAVALAMVGQDRESDALRVQRAEEEVGRMGEVQARLREEVACVGREWEAAMEALRVAEEARGVAVAAAERAEDERERVVGLMRVAVEAREAAEDTLVGMGREREGLLEEQARLQAVISQLELQREDLAGAMGELRGQMACLEKDRQEAEIARDAAVVAARAAKEALDVLRGQVAHGDEAAGVLLQAREELKLRVGEIERERDVLAEAKAALEEQLAAITGELGGLQRQLGEQAVIVTQLEERAAAVSQEKVTVTTQLAEKVTVMSQLEERITGMEQEKEEVARRVVAAEAERDEAARNLSNAQSRMEEMQGERNAALASLTTAQMHLQEVKGQLEAALEGVVDAQLRMRELEGEREGALESLEAARVQMAAVEGERDAALARASMAVEERDAAAVRSELAMEVRSNAVERAELAAEDAREAALTAGRAAEERDAALLDVERALREREAAVVALEQAVVELERAKEERDEAVVRAERAVEERDQLAQGFSRVVETRDEGVATDLPGCGDEVVSHTVSTMVAKDEEPRECDKCQEVEREREGMLVRLQGVRGAARQLATARAALSTALSPSSRSSVPVQLGLSQGDAASAAHPSSLGAHMVGLEGAGIFVHEDTCLLDAVDAVLHGHACLLDINEDFAPNNIKGASNSKSQPALADGCLAGASLGDTGALLGAMEQVAAELLAAATSLSRARDEVSTLTQRHALADGQVAELAQRLKAVTDLATAAERERTMAEKERNEVLDRMAEFERAAQTAQREAEQAAAERDAAAERLRTLETSLARTTASLLEGDEAKRAAAQLQAAADAAEESRRMAIQRAQLAEEQKREAMAMAAAAEAERVRTEARALRAEADAGALRSRLCQLEGERDDIMAGVYVARAQVAVLEARARELERARARAECHLAETEEELDVTAASAAVAAGELDVMVARVMGLESELDDSFARLECMRVELREALAHADEVDLALDASRRRVVDVEGELDEAVATVLRVEIQLDEATGRLREVEADLANALDHVAEMAREREGTLAKLKEAERELREVAGRLAASDVAKETAEKQGRGLQGNIEKLQGELRDLGEKGEAAAAERDYALARVARAEAERDVLAGRREELERALEGARRDVMAMDAEREGYALRVAESAARLAAAEAELARVVAERDEAAMGLEQANTRAQELEAERQAALEGVADAELRMRELEGEREGALESFEGARVRIAAVEAERDAAVARASMAVEERDAAVAAVRAWEGRVEEAERVRAVSSSAAQAAVIAREAEVDAREAEVNGRVRDMESKLKQVEAAAATKVQEAESNAAVRVLQAESNAAAKVQQVEDEAKVQVMSMATRLQEAEGEAEASKLREKQVADASAVRLAELDARLVAAMACAEDARAEHAEALRRAEALQGDVQVALARAAAAEAERDEAAQQLAEEEAALAEARGALRSCQVALEETSAARAAAVSRVAELEGEREGASERALALESERSALLAATCAMEEERDAAAVRAEEAFRELASAVEQLGRVQAERDNALASMEEWRCVAEKVSRERDAAVDRLAGLQTALEEAVETREKVVADARDEALRARDEREATEAAGNISRMRELEEQLEEVRLEYDDALQGTAGVARDLEGTLGAVEALAGTLARVAEERDEALARAAEAGRRLDEALANVTALEERVKLWSRPRHLASPGAFSAGASPSRVGADSALVRGDLTPACAGELTPPRDGEDSRHSNNVVRGVLSMGSGDQAAVIVPAATTTRVGGKNVSPPRSAAASAVAMSPVRHASPAAHGSPSSTSSSGSSPSSSGSLPEAKRSPREPKSASQVFAPQTSAPHSTVTSVVTSPEEHRLVEDKPRGTDDKQGGQPGSSKPRSTTPVRRRLLPSPPPKRSATARARPSAAAVMAAATLEPDVFTVPYATVTTGAPQRHSTDAGDKAGGSSPLLSGLNAPSVTAGGEGDDLALPGGMGGLLCMGMLGPLREEGDAAAGQRSPLGGAGDDIILGAGGDDISSTLSLLNEAGLRGGDEEGPGGSLAFASVSLSLDDSFELDGRADGNAGDGFNGNTGSNREPAVWKEVPVGDDAESGSNQEGGATAGWWRQRVAELDAESCAWSAEAARFRSLLESGEQAWAAEKARLHAQVEEMEASAGALRARVRALEGSLATQRRQLEEAEGRRVLIDQLGEQLRRREEEVNGLWQLVSAGSGDDSGKDALMTCPEGSKAARLDGNDGEYAWGTSLRRRSRQAEETSLNPTGAAATGAAAGASATAPTAASTLKSTLSGLAEHLVGEGSSLKGTLSGLAEALIGDRDRGGANNGPEDDDDESDAYQGGSHGSGSGSSAAGNAAGILCGPLPACNHEAVRLLLVSLRSELRAAQATIRDLQGEAQSLVKRAGRSEEECSHVWELLANSRAQVDSLTNDLAARAESQGAQEGKLEKLLKQVKEQAESIEGLRKALEDARSARVKARKEEAAARRQRQGEMDKLSDELARVVAEMDKERAERGALREELRGREEELARCTAELGDRYREVQELRIAVAALPKQDASTGAGVGSHLPAAARGSQIGSQQTAAHHWAAQRGDGKEVASEGVITAGSSSSGHEAGDEGTAAAPGGNADADADADATPRCPPGSIAVSMPTDDNAGMAVAGSVGEGLVPFHREQGVAAASMLQQQHQWLARAQNAVFKGLASLSVQLTRLEVSRKRGGGGVLTRGGTGGGSSRPAGRGASSGGSSSSGTPRAGVELDVNHCISEMSSLMRELHEMKRAVGGGGQVMAAPSNEGLSTPRGATIALSSGTATPVSAQSSRSRGANEGPSGDAPILAGAELAHRTGAWSPGADERSPDVGAPPGGRRRSYAGKHGAMPAIPPTGPPSQSVTAVEGGAASAGFDPVDSAGCGKSMHQVPVLQVPQVALQGARRGLLRASACGATASSGSGITSTSQAGIGSAGGMTGHTSGGAISGEIGSGSASLASMHSLVMGQMERLGEGNRRFQTGLAFENGELERLGAHIHEQRRQLAQIVSSDVSHIRRILDQYEAQRLPPTPTQARSPANGSVAVGPQANALNADPLSLILTFARSRGDGAAGNSDEITPPHTPRSDLTTMSMPCLRGVPSNSSPRGAHATPSDASDASFSSGAPADAALGSLTGYTGGGGLEGGVPMVGHVLVEPHALPHVLLPPVLEDLQGSPSASVFQASPMDSPASKSSGADSMEDPSPIKDELGAESAQVQAPLMGDGAVPVPLMAPATLVVSPLELSDSTPPGAGSPAVGSLANVSLSFDEGGSSHGGANPGPRDARNSTVYGDGSAQFPAGFNHFDAENGELSSVSAGSACADNPSSDFLGDIEDQLDQQLLGEDQALDKESMCGGPSGILAAMSPAPARAEDVAAEPSMADSSAGFRAPATLDSPKAADNPKNTKRQARQRQRRGGSKRGLFDITNV